MDLIADKEYVEEDFSELYAQVEAQASFSITGTARTHTPPPESVCKPCIETEERENTLSKSQTESTRFDNCASCSEEDDDELDILLNDDDGEEQEEDDEHQNERVEVMKNVNSRSSFHYKYLRGDISSIPAQRDVARIVDGSCRGGVVWENKFTNSVRCRQYGYGFMLPSNRTIMDVDIDMFREKPWRYPEVDLTDYFNFGLGEESWKEYRNSLTCKVGSERRNVSKMEVGDLIEAAERRKRPLELPRGRAIKVQSSLCERQSSVDVKYDHIQDSDVIIQITLQETEEGPSGSGKEEHYQKDSDVTSKDGASHVIDERGVCHCGRANEDEPVGSSEESLGKSSSCRRCFEIRTTSNQISSDTGNHNRTIQEKVNLRTSEAIEEARGGNEASEQDDINAHESDPTITETDLSIGDRTCFSPTPSCFGSDSEASKDEKFDEPGKVHGADARLPEPVKPYSDFKMKMRDAKNNLRHRSPILDEQKRHSRRSHDVSEQKLYSENDDHAFRRRGVKGDRERYGRREIRFHEDCKGYSRRGCNNTKWKFHNGTEHNASPMLDSKELQDMDQLSRDCSKQNDSWYDFSYDDRDDLSYFREVRRFNNHGIEKFANDCFKDVRTRDHFGEVRRGLKNELTPKFKQRWNERVHFSQRRSTLENEDILDRDLKHHGRMSPQFKRRWTEREYYSERCSGIENEDILDRYHERISPQFKQRWTEREYFSERCSGIGDGDIFERDLKLHASRFSTRATIPLHCQKPRGWATSDLKENHSFGRRNVDNPRFRKRIDDESHFPDRRHEDEFVKRKDGIFVSCSDREMDRLHETYQNPSSSIKFSSRGASYGGISHVDEDCKWSMGIGSERRSNTDHKSSSYQSNRGSYKTGVGRGSDMVSPTNDTYQFTSTTKYGKGERLVSDRVDDSANAVDYSYEQDHLDRRRRRRYEYDWHEARHWDDQLYAEEESYSHEKTAMHEGFDDKFEATCRGMFIDDYHPDYHKPKILRRSENNLDRISDVICRGSELEQTIPRDRGSGDFTVDKGKSAGRCSGRLAKMDGSHVKEKSLNCFSEPHARRALQRVQTDIPINDSNKNNEKKLDEFPVTESNKDRDIEEGQIITEEPIVNDHLNKKRNSEGVATTRNVKKRISHCESALGEKVVVEELDNQRILETMAKMEKRRERFKDPVTLKRETETSITLPADFDSTTETKQIRPARKRRWSGS